MQRFSGACFHAGASIVNFFVIEQMLLPLLFLSSIEPVIPDFSAILYFVLLHGTVGVGFFCA
jgi:hypothetical protein